MLFRSDRKSTRLNSSHTIISYAVFCLKKKRVRQVEADEAEHDRIRASEDDDQTRPHTRHHHARPRRTPASRPPSGLPQSFFLMKGPPPGSALFPPAAPSR